MAFNWMEELAQGIQGGLVGYQAGSSPGRQPGFAGFAEAVTMPGQVIKRGRNIAAMDQAAPFLEEIKQLAQSGDIWEARKRSIQIGSHLLKNGVDREMVQYIIHEAAQPILAAQLGQYLSKQVQGVDLSTPEGANRAAQAMIQTDPGQLPQAANLAQGAARVQSAAEVAKARAAAAQQGLALRERQIANTEATGALSRQNLESQMNFREWRKSNALPGSGGSGNPNAITRTDRLEKDAEREYRSIDDAVNKIQAKVAAGDMDQQQANQMLGSLNVRIARANKRYGRQVPSVFASPGDFPEPTIDPTSGEKKYPEPPILIKRGGGSGTSSAPSPAPPTAPTPTIDVNAVQRIQAEYRSKVAANPQGAAQYRAEAEALLRAMGIPD